MPKFLKSFKQFLCSLLLISVLCACNSSSTAGLEAFQSSDGTYGFFYPTGWTRISVTGGPEVVFHDVINSDETLSLVVSDIENGLDLDSIGGPIQIGESLIEEVFASDGSGRQADLLQASRREERNHIFYDLEYTIHLPDRDRHELATVVVNRGALFTLAASTNETRWPKVKGIFERVITSFNFYSS
ncbi:MULTISPECIES: photosystem II reaction center PsbP [Prochlorococcus]|uniref:photosystem II reaction center PsbP n=1 Tax=Prochlorococcus TaxID=1218 RepID=UPI0005338F1A|nr:MULTISPECIES: photosystem II reaction center PsbP [Prochlorococcus]KGG12260.1 Photosystem II oxygen evolving complex protein PsbP [Prochlorococcus sp. MIT 0601]